MNVGWVKKQLGINACNYYVAIITVGFACENITFFLEYYSGILY